MCFSPISVHYYDRLLHAERYRDVPCGKCLDCLRKYQNDWEIRTSWQLKDTPKAVFFTLTYRNATAPVVYNDDTGEVCFSVCKADVQKWLKRCRMSFCRAKGISTSGIKYFICSEYGPRTWRPHYHGIIYGLSLVDFKVYFANDWHKNFGFTRQSLINVACQGAGRYVAKYCSKGQFECPLVSEGLVERPFRLVSKGYGKIYVDLNKDWHLNTDASDADSSCYVYQYGKVFNKHVTVVASRMRVFHNGFYYSLPKYYKSLIFGSGQEDLEKCRFRSSLSDYFQSKSDYLFNEKFEVLSRRFSPDEASHKLSLQEEATLSARFRKTITSFESFYNKSKI